MPNKMVLFYSLLMSISTLAQTSTLFLTPIQKTQLFEQTMNDIERLDAAAIEVRNNHKSVKWPQFKEEIKAQFINAKNWSELEIAIKNLNNGFINLHSSISYKGPKNEDKAPSEELNVKLQYLLPNLTFYLRSNGQSVSKVNGVSINKRFQQFENYECRFNQQTGCAALFAEAFNHNKIKVDDKAVSTITLVDGQKISVRSKVIDSPMSLIEKYVTESCESISSRYKEWELVLTGQNICLLKREKTLLLKIKMFGYQHATFDLYCEKDYTAGSLCHDVQLLIRAMKDLPNDHLIVDVQNNPGGQEVTSLLTVLMPKSFKDNLVAYRFSEELKDKELRKGLNYFEDNAENWFQSLSLDVNKPATNQFLSARSDFCRGSNNCSNHLIRRHPKAAKFKRYTVLTNHYCVSSCDDLVWRMSDFAGASVVGLPQAADGTYARISGSVYIDSKGNVQSKRFADGGSANLAPTDRPIIEYRIPYSRTLTRDGELREGLPIELSHIFPITKENFDDLDADFANRAFHLKP